MKKICSLALALFASNFAYADYYDKVERCENFYKIEAFYEMDFDKVHGEAFGNAGDSQKRVCSCAKSAALWGFDMQAKQFKEAMNGRGALQIKRTSSCKYRTDDEGGVGKVTVHWKKVVF